MPAKGALALDKEQVGKAVDALLKYIGKEKDDAALLEDEELLYLVLALKKAPQTPRNDKPHRLALPHPIYTLKGTDICLFVKDHKGEGHKEAKEKHAKMEGTGISKIIGLSKLRTKYESYEAKRQLCTSYDIFLADDRILPSLPKLLGKSFFKKKKQPVPIRVAKGGDWGKEVRKALSGTYYFHTGGTSISIKVARSGQTQEEVVANVVAAVEAVVPLIPKKAKNIQALYLKTAESVALPVYQALPEGVQRVVGASGKGGKKKGAKDESDSEDDS